MEPLRNKKVSCGLCVWHVVIVLTLDWFQVKEKEMMYKRYREEAESAKQVCGVKHLVLLSCSFETIPVWRRFYTRYYFNAIWNHPCNVSSIFLYLKQQMEEEKALKQLRRTLVPHARPVPNFGHPFLPQKYAKHGSHFQFYLFTSSVFASVLTK